MPFGGLGRKCLDCCFKKSVKNGGKCCNKDCQLSYHSIPFFQRCLTCNDLVHIGCSIFVQNDLECQHLCPECAKKNTELQGFTPIQTAICSSRYHWFFSNNIFSQASTLYDDFNTVTLVQSNIHSESMCKRSQVHGVLETVSVFVGSLSTADEPHV